MPPRATPSRERIVIVAIAPADERVRGDITLRALSARLGVRSPMALYRHVGSKDGLADLVADRIYAQLTVPRGRGWRAALRELGRSGWQAVQQHPWFARLALRRAPLGPGALVVDDTALAELEPRDLDAVAAPYLRRIAEAGSHPHLSRGAADPHRHADGPQSFEQVLDWLLDGLESLR